MQFLHKITIFLLPDLFLRFYTVLTMSIIIIETVISVQLKTVNLNTNILQVNEYVMKT